MGAVKVVVHVGQLAVSLNTHLQGLVLNRVSSEQPPGFSYSPGHGLPVPLCTAVVCLHLYQEE